MKFFLLFRLVAMLASTVFAATLAQAHGDEVHSAQSGAHGGQVAVAGAYHLELVVIKDSKEAKDNPVVVFVTDQKGASISTLGASGSAILLTGKQKTTLALAADAENRLKGMAAYASSPDMKVIVSVTLPGKAPEQARFTPLARR